MMHQLSPDKPLHDSVAIICTGDIVLDEPAPEYWLEGIVPAFRRADLVIGHLEVPHTRRQSELPGDVPAPGADPDNLAALKSAGFAAMTLAGNHIADCGPGGITDTIDALENLGIACCGAGPHLAQARQPALLGVGERTVAVLSYNCVGPKNGWATAERAGCAFLPVATANGEPVAPAQTFTHAEPQAQAILVEDIAAAKEKAGLVIVALHKGRVHTPAVVEDYERELARAAIDAGADVVISHHAHIVRGIEFYRGKPVFHGLGNGCVVTRALSPDQEHPARAGWAEKRKALFGFEPDPDFFLAPFHPEAVQAFMARILWHGDDSVEIGIIPVQVDAPGKPRLANREESDRISAYVEQITRQAGLAAISLGQNADMMTITPNPMSGMKTA